MWWWRSGGQTRPQGGSHGAHYGWSVVFHARERRVGGWRWMGPTSGDVWLVVVVVVGGGWVLGNRLPSELLGMRALHPPPRWM
ncbi:unnamed protein product [Prunus armeniaca]|uniref:Uncharacterized protein n=1 Tax=Prunus armeniaca TaxID=36596 RepID=A0A6J5XPK8_PRUAR|nr:unnamed protein product [Prunus armeniaca]